MLEGPNKAKDAIFAALRQKYGARIGMLFREKMPACFINRQGVKELRLVYFNMADATARKAWEKARKEHLASNNAMPDGPDQDVNVAELEDLKDRYLGVGHLALYQYAPLHLPKAVREKMISPGGQGDHWLIAEFYLRPAAKDDTFQAIWGNDAFADEVVREVVAMCARLRRPLKGTGSEVPFPIEKIPLAGRSKKTA
ncbi:MAG TPA: hypothetical protein VHD37_01990 [Candidatus Paceibacterota bacterium]|nr:hypothetical protein [Candidatus Paceibacterota bacterium]